jgi:enoyl-CoA hydratase/carnithine racemase
MLRIEPEGPILRLTLARPEVRNALDDSLVDALAGAFANVPPGTRAVLLAGEGRSFCAGGDLEWMRRAAGYTEEENFQDALRLVRLFRAIVECPALVVARVNGHAFGGACGLVAASDVAIASAETQFSFSEVRLGLVPATIGAVVTEKIGPGHARALFTTGEVFDAERALRIGLVHQVVLPEQLDRAVQDKLDQALSVGPNALAACKNLAREPLSGDDAARLLARTRSSAEAREGIGAFLEKRRPSFAITHETST